MPVPSSLNDLSTTPSLNSPAGSESPALVDDYLRTHAAFIKQVDNAVDALDATAAKSATLAASGGSALVGYLPAGTGAVATNVQTKLREFVSVKDFGAVGDGVTDDTAAIQAAISSGAGAVFFPSGTYISRRITIAASVRLYGIGPASEVKYKDGEATSIASDADNSLFRIATHDIRVEFANLTLNGNYTGQGDANGSLATETTNATTGTVVTYGDIIRVQKPVPSAATDVLELIVTNCLLKKGQNSFIAFTGLEDSSGTERLVVEGCTFVDPAPGLGSSSGPGAFEPDFIAASGAVELMISNNSFQCFRDPTATQFNYPPCAIRVTISLSPDPTPEYSGVQIIGNTFEGCGRATAAGAPLGVVDVYACGERVAVTGNTFKSNRFAAIRAKSNARQMAVVGNVVQGNSLSGGIVVARLSEPDQNGEYVISSNVVVDVVGEGIAVVGDSATSPNYTKNVIVSGNIVSSQGESAIYIDRCTDVIVTNNLVKSTTTAGSDGIEFINCAGNITITGNTVMSTAAVGILMNAATGTTRLVCNNNQINTTGDDGILITTSGGITGDFVVCNNIVQNATGEGINLLRTLGAVNVSGNRIKTTTSIGLRLEALDTTDVNVFYVEGNLIDAVQQYGVYCKNAYTIQLANNTVSNVTGATSRGFYLDDSQSDAVVIGNVAVIGVTTPAYLFNTTEAPRAREQHNSWNDREIKGTAAPTTGTWGVGDIVWNSNPAAAGNIGWVCTTAGSPGTWKTFGAIAA